MKVRVSPLFVASIGVIIFGFFYIFYKIDSTIGMLVAILLMLLGILCFIAYFILHIVFRTRFWLQVLVEMVLIVIISFSCYKLTGKVLLHVPPNFKGNILLVYGVDNQPRLRPSSILNRNIDVEVPPSGIILISNKFAEKYFNNLLIIDSLNSHVFEPDTTYDADTLKCGNKLYNYEVFDYAFPSTSINLKADTLDKNLKTERACKMLGIKIN